MRKRPAWYRFLLRRRRFFYWLVNTDGPLYGFGWLLRAVQRQMEIERAEQFRRDYYRR